MIIDEEKKKNEDNNNNLIDEKEQLYSSVFIDEKNFENIFKFQSHEINNKNKKLKKISKSIRDFLTVDDLFDVNNHEGKEEAIIDDELHSDDEEVFEIKVKPLKKIAIHYIPKIKKQVPKINLAQIEFNKQKVMNEADLYSLQRRKYKMQNLDENIKTMKKKIKKLKHICKLNKKKKSAFEKYAKNIEEYYKALKPLKIQSSLGGAKIPKIQKFFQEGGDNNINININGIDDIDLGDEDSDNENLGIEDIYEANIIEANTGNGISISDKNNVIIENNYLNNKDNHIKHMKSIRKKNNFNNASIRANSK